MISSSGYIYLSVFARPLIIRMNVSGPSRPANMIATRINRPAQLTSEVIPVDNPTVAKALMTSNPIQVIRPLPSGTGMSDSVIISIIVVAMTMVRQTTRSENTCTMVLWGIVRPNPPTWSRPLMRDPINSSMNASEVVLIPPAVEPGDPPMNISTIITRSIGSDRAPISSVLKPAVRVVIDCLEPSGLPARVAAALPASFSQPDRPIPSGIIQHSPHRAESVV